ncbi:MAG TPA: DUF4242 domain-containing protein [Agriterribacter sp.]|nr:DUF4242 domain-containing protein [Chitinophagaceae bacterium]HRP31359.1 DUF4242 domain-containing protein [Agriterribacter sp.]
MKINYSAWTLIILGFAAFQSIAQSNTSVPDNKKMYIDVHRLAPGKVKFEEVAEAHKKDLAIQEKYGVNFIKYWVDEKQGVVYCLSSADDSTSVGKTHAEAHGLLPNYTYEVTEGEAAEMQGNKKLFLDIHHVGAGKVTAAAVAEAHKKDLAVQDKRGVNFINYWVDEKAGVVLCLSEAKNAKSVIHTHKEAHGLTPAEVRSIKQGE